MGNANSAGKNLQPGGNVNSADKDLQPDTGREITPYQAPSSPPPTPRTVDPPVFFDRTDVGFNTLDWAREIERAPMALEDDVKPPPGFEKAVEDDVEPPPGFEKTVEDDIQPPPGFEKGVEDDVQPPPGFENHRPIRAQPLAVGFPAGTFKMQETALAALTKSTGPFAIDRSQWGRRKKRTTEFLEETYISFDYIKPAAGSGSIGVKAYQDLEPLNLLNPDRNRFSDDELKLPMPVVLKRWRKETRMRTLSGLKDKFYTHPFCPKKYRSVHEVAKYISECNNHITPTLANPVPGSGIRLQVRKTPSVPRLTLSENTNKRKNRGSFSAPKPRVANPVQGSDIQVEQTPSFLRLTLPENTNKKKNGSSFSAPKPAFANPVQESGIELQDSRTLSVSRLTLLKNRNKRKDEGSLGAPEPRRVKCTPINLAEEEKVRKAREVKETLASAWNNLMKLFPAAMPQPKSFVHTTIDDVESCLEQLKRQEERGKSRKQPAAPAVRPAPATAAAGVPDQGGNQDDNDKADPPKPLPYLLQLANNSGGRIIRGPAAGNPSALPVDGNGRERDVVTPTAAPPSGGGNQKGRVFSYNPITNRFY